MTARRLVLTFTTTMRMVYWVHNSTTNARTNALPAITACFTNLNVAMLGIANFAYGCAAGNQNTTHFRRRHTKNSVVALFTHELNASASRTSNCSTATRLKLNSMDERTYWNCGKRQCVTRLDVSINTRDYRFANFEALWMKDVALLTICIVKKSDTCTAVRVVLDRCNFCRNTILVALDYFAKS